MQAQIFEIKRFAVHDGNGIRTAIFFKGCPLRCLWCHNPEGLTSQPEVANYKNRGEVHYGEQYSVNELMNIVLKDKDFYDATNGGVTLSGGECLLQSDFCAEFLKELKAVHINTAVDTSGYVGRSSIDKVMPYTDIFLYDIKAYDETIHIKCTGRSNKLILDNLQYIDECGKEVEIRFPLVPGYNDDQIEKIAEFLSSLKHITGVRVLPYHYPGSKYEALGQECSIGQIKVSAEEVHRCKEILERYNLRTV